MLELYEKKQNIPEEISDSWKVFLEKVNALNQELKSKTNTLLEMVPEELEEYGNEYIQSHEKLIPEIIKYGRVITCIKSDDFDIYGFKNITDAINKFKKLKNAWKGIIHMEIKNNKSYIDIIYTLGKHL